MTKGRRVPPMIRALAAPDPEAQAKAERAREDYTALKLYAIMAGDLYERAKAAGVPQEVREELYTMFWVLTERMQDLEFLYGRTALGLAEGEGILRPGGVLQ